MTMSYLSAIERYHDHQEAINTLIEAMVFSLTEHPLWQSSPMQAFCEVKGCYDFAQMCYLLDAQGCQVGNNLTSLAHLQNKGDKVDRSSRPYFNSEHTEQAMLCTQPYISVATGDLCISLRAPVKSDSEVQWLIIDVSLVSLVEYVMGDAQRSKFSTFFKLGYSVIVVSLFILVCFLMYRVCTDIAELLFYEQSNDVLKPFGIIIFITLSLSIFDLGKTIFEEEILMHKDIFRHSSTRRTITRFISTILIAISIEALLTMFKASLGQSEYALPALMMMASVVGLLIGLSVYVFLGAKAELLLIQGQQARRAKHM